MVRKGSAKVTLADVAARASVSVTTASFVPSGRRDMRISEGTQERVDQAARQRGSVASSCCGASEKAPTWSAANSANARGRRPVTDRTVSVVVAWSPRRSAL